MIAERALAPLELTLIISVWLIKRKRIWYMLSYIEAILKPALVIPNDNSFRFNHILGIHYSPRECPCYLDHPTKKHDFR